MLPDLTFLYLLALSLLLTGCEINTSGNWDGIRKDICSQFPTVKQISTEELQKWLTAQGPANPLLIDRREAEEYAVSHLPEAFLASGEKDALNIIEKEGKDRPVVIYCSVGYRSSVLARKLEEKGLANVYNLEGSIIDGGKSRSKKINRNPFPWSSQKNFTLKNIS